MVACESLYSGHNLSNKDLFMSKLVRKSLLELEFGNSTFSHTSFERTQFRFVSDRCTEKPRTYQSLIQFQNFSNLISCI